MLSEHALNQAEQLPDAETYLKRARIASEKFPKGRVGVMVGKLSELIKTDAKNPKYAARGEFWSGRNGDEIWAIIENGVVVTIMPRRSGEKTDGLRVEKTYRVK